jgi:Tol biopolymer transport system component
MDIEPGRMLLHYRLTEKIGEGGMGAVWKARDTTLDRDVAIKILPEVFVADPARLARFEREAKLIASLSHPNIVGIHGLHSDGDVRFLSMELVEGEDLADRLKRGPLSVEEALKIGAQIAEALEAAHEAGVIHRDLKPANILLMPGARAKVLDFGLAKAIADEPGPSGQDLQHSPTVTSLESTPGVVLGTAAYMSPEQARGKPLDRRTDIWSFGCVLYECLTAKTLFTGETVTDVLSAILQREPDWEALPAETPPRARDLLERCLERSLRDRLHDVADARIVLERSVATREWTTSGITAAVDLPGPRRRVMVHRWALLAAGLLLGIVGTFVVSRGLAEPERELPLRKFQLETIGRGSFLPEISPDGTRVAYIDDGRLWVRDLARYEAQPLVGGVGVSLHTWSPDGEWLAISKDSQLWKLPATGGEAVLLAPLPESLSQGKAAELTWGTDGRIVFNVGDTGLRVVSDQGGAVTSLLEPAEGELDFHHVFALPDGRGYLFGVHTNEAMDRIDVLSDAGRKTVLQVPGQDVGRPVYSPSGHLLFASRPDNAGIWAVPFSLEKLEVTDAAFPVTATDRLRFNVSRDGTLVFTRPAPPRDTRLVLVDRQGLVVRALGEPRPEMALPSVSPDGGRIAVQAGATNRDIWIYEIDSGTQLRLTFEDDDEYDPAWLPDGKELAFVRAGRRTGEQRVVVAAADGSGEARSLVTGLEPSFSKDGRFIVYSGQDANLDHDVWYAPIDGSGTVGEPVELIETDGNFYPQFSPDGRLLVYASVETGRSEVYLTRFPGGEGKWQISKDGGDRAFWNADGDRIYYRRGRDLMEVSVRGGNSPSLGAPRKLFAFETLGRGYDVVPDGQHFVMIEETDPSAPGPRITVVQDWAAEFEPQRR